ncbi:hypothetical protein Tco_0424141 [Tanacetum coccineum]
MVNEVDTVLPVDGLSDPEVYYEVSGMVRRRNKWGGYDFRNPEGWNWLAVTGRNETTPTKRPRKKKTLAELKDDETTLLKERKQLKRQVANLLATCEKRRKENESLNKMKNDMQPHKQGLATSEVNDHTEEKDGGFVLPDLNIPAGEEE